MKPLLVFFFMFSFGLMGYGQPKVILDADIDSDVDDVAALAMLNMLHNNKQVELIGVVVTSDDPYAAACADAINHYFGNNKIPIGFLHGLDQLKNHSKYTKQVSEEFEHSVKTYSDAEDAVSLYRRLLATEKDNSVIVVTIGHLSSLQGLLKSGADQYSSLSGKELAHKKMLRWICMGGMFPAGKEANFYRPDPVSTGYCVRTWTKPVVFCGWEAGKEIITGGEYLKKRLNENNPVYRGFELYNHFAGRPSWDQVAILLLTKESGQYFDLVKNGRCEVAPDGSNTWVKGEESNQAYVALKNDIDPALVARHIDEMIINNKK